VHCTTVREEPGFKADATTRRATKSTGDILMLLLISGRAKSCMQPILISQSSLDQVREAV